MELATNVDLTRWLIATGVLIIMLGAFALLLFKLRNPAAQGGSRQLKRLETLPLGARHRLHLVQDGEQEHLILIGPQTETILQTRKPKGRVTK
jgi:flagellar biogenesis protein FliO